jgi:hypothetical protein
MPDGAQTFLAWAFQINKLFGFGMACVEVIIGAVWTWFRGMATRGRIKELSSQLASDARRMPVLRGQ